MRPLRLLLASVALAGCSSSPLEPEEPVESKPVERRRPACVGVAIAGIGHDYCLMKESVTFEAAKARCRSTGLHLAEIASSEENSAISDGIARLSPAEGVYAFWIGLARTDGEWRWPSAATFSSPSSTIAWAPNEPNNAGGNESCGEYIIGANLLNDLTCNQPRPFICEATALDEHDPFRCDAAPVTTRFGHYCLHAERSLDFQSASERCRASGAALADLSTPGEARALSEAVAPPIDAGSVWIGATDDGHERDFRWTSGAPLLFSAWGPGEPNNAGVENCTELIFRTGKWNDMKCEAKRPPLCEAPSRMSASPR